MGFETRSVQGDRRREQRIRRPNPTKITAVRKTEAPAVQRYDRDSPFAGQEGAQRISACRTASRDRRCGQPVDTWPMLSVVPSPEMLANARVHEWIAHLPEDRPLAQQPYKTQN